MAGRPESITVSGCLMAPGASKEDYADFLGSSFMLVDIRATLDQGHFPPGLILSDEFGRRAIVQGAYGSRQTVRWFNG